MELLITFQKKVILLVTLTVTFTNLVNGQMSRTCTTSMISSFTPCANIITGSSNNGLVPPNTCCDSLRSLMSTNLDCACSVMSINAPFFQALVLPISQACNINGTPLLCKASGSPLPAPGPAAFGPIGPTLPSPSASPLSPQVSETRVVAEAQRYKNLQLAWTVTRTPASPPVVAETPTRTPRIRPVLTLSPSSTSHRSSVSFSPLAFILIGMMLFSSSIY